MLHVLKQSSPLAFETRRCRRDRISQPPVQVRNSGGRSGGLAHPTARGLPVKSFDKVRISDEDPEIEFLESEGFAHYGPITATSPLDLWQTRTDGPGVGFCSGRRIDESGLLELTVRAGGLCRSRIDVECTRGKLGPQNLYPSCGICQGLAVTSGRAGDPDSGDS